MKKLIALGIILIHLMIMASFTEPSTISGSSVRTYVLNELKIVRMQLAESKLQLGNSERLRQLYYLTRQHYKHCEFFIEYCSPRESKYSINGPWFLNTTLILAPRYFTREAFNGSKNYCSTMQKKQIQQNFPKNTGYLIPSLANLLTTIRK